MKTHWQIPRASQLMSGAFFLIVLMLLSSAASAQDNPLDGPVAGPWFRTLPNVTDPLNDPQIRKLLEARAREARAPQGTAAIALQTKVTANPAIGSCSGPVFDAVKANIGNEVRYCYRVSNTGTVALDVHDLVSTQFGGIRLGDSITLAPGASISVDELHTVNDSQVNTATWYARTEAPSYSQIDGSCTFPEISPTGTPLNLGDDGTGLITLPDPFPVYGAMTNTLRVCNNGYVSFPFSEQSETSCAFGNVAFPSVAAPLTIAPFFDDMDSETGNVYHGPYNYNSQGESPAGVTSYMIVEWFNRSHFPGPSASTATFAMGMLRPGQGLDGYVFTCYDDTDFDNPAVDFGASATIGTNRNAGLAQQYSFNTANPLLNGSFGLGFLPINAVETASATDTAAVVAFLFQDSFE